MIRFAPLVLVILTVVAMASLYPPAKSDQGKLPESGSGIAHQPHQPSEGFIAGGYESYTELGRVTDGGSEGPTESWVDDRREPTPVGVAILNPKNGHYYKYVELRDVTWSRAFRMAATLSHQQLQGYLVTVSSQEENEFLLRHWGDRSHAWIGASDQKVEVEWRWMCGPEVGGLFWLGTKHGEPAGFSAWKTNEPNNSFPSSTDPSDEDFACLNYERGGWNDLPNDPVKGVFRPHGFIVEFSPK